MSQERKNETLPIYIANTGKYLEELDLRWQTWQTQVIKRMNAFKNQCQLK